MCQLAGNRMHFVLVPWCMGCIGRNFHDKVHANVAVVCVLSSTASISTLFIHPFHPLTRGTSVRSQLMIKLGGTSSIPQLHVCSQKIPFYFLKIIRLKLTFAVN